MNIHYGTDGSTRSYFVTALSPGQTYNDPHNDLIITATDEVDISDGALSTTAMGVQICQGACSSIAAPTNLTATASGTNAIDLDWVDNSDNEDGFRLEHSINGSDWDVPALSDNAVPPFQHTGLDTASTHFYRVQAYNTGDVSGWSNTASATTDAIPPTASFTWIDDLTEVRFTDASIDDGTISSWSWDFDDGNSATTQNPQHIYASAGEYTVSLTVTDNHGASDTTSDLVSVEGPLFSEHFALSESTPGGTVSGSYTLTHTDEAGDGSAQSITERQSGGKPANRHSWLEHQWTFNNIPTGKQAMLTVNAWRTNNTEIDNFDFEYSTNGNDWTHMFTVGNENTDANYYPSLTGVSGTVYVRVTDTDQSQSNNGLDTVFVDYMVIRVDNDGGGDIAPDGNPSELSAMVVDYVNVNLSWIDGSTNETGFRVKRRIVDPTSTTWTIAGETGANGTSFQDTGLLAGTSYEYQVIAFNFGGDSAPTEVKAVTTGTPPPPPAIELFVAANKIKAKNAPQLTWNPDTITMDAYFNDSTSALETGVSSGWTHETGLKERGVSYTYVVCKTDAPLVCSAPVTVDY